MQAEPSPPTYKISDILKSDPKKLSGGEIKNIYCVPMQASSGFINVAYITNYYCSKLMSFTSDGQILHQYIFESGSVHIVVLNSKIVLLYSVIKYNGDYNDWIAVWDPFTDNSKQIKHCSYYDQDQISSIQLLAFQDTSLFCICQIQHNQKAQPQYCIIMYYNMKDFSPKQQSDTKNVPSCIHSFKYEYSDEQKKNRCYPIKVERQGKIMFVSTRQIVVNDVKQKNQNDIDKQKCQDDMEKLGVGVIGENIKQGSFASVEIGYYLYKLNSQTVKNCSVYKFPTKSKQIQILKVWQQTAQTLIIWKQCQNSQNPHYCTFNQTTKHYHELQQQNLDNIVLSVQYYGHAQQPTKYNINSHTFETAYWDYASNSTKSNALKVIVRYQFGSQYACNAVYLSKPTIGNNKYDSFGRFQIRYTDNMIVMYSFVAKDIIIQALVLPELLYQANKYAVYFLVQSIEDCDEDLLAAVFDLV